MTKWELHMKDRPSVRITVSTPQQVRELEAHGWSRVQATVTVKAEAAKK